MNLLEKLIASQKDAISTREVHYGKLISYTNARPAMVHGEPKDKLLAVVELAGVKTQHYIFKDSVYGLPSFVPAGGVNCQITLQPATGDDGVEYINAVAIGIEAAK